MATYAISDLHSCMAVWKKVKDYLDEDDVLYVLGDSCDRGPDGIDVLMDLLRRPNTYMIKGNHDDFMLNSLKGILSGENIYNEIYMWLSNGGSHTYDTVIARDDDFIRGLLFQIEAMPTRFDYINTKGQTIILTHAGFNPFSAVYNSYLEENNIKKINEIYMWDRNLTDTWINEFNGKDYTNIYLVHGHTPAIVYGVSGADFYADGHKINIDMGTFYTHKTCLLNLDTFEPKYFFEEGYESLGK